MWFLLFPLLFNSISGDIIAEKKCSNDEFPKPYVILWKTKGGVEVASLETQGLIDLREAIGHYVCINGAAVVYASASVHKEAGKPAENDLKHVANFTAGETVRYANGSVQVFNHKCLHINRLSSTQKSSGKPPDWSTSPIVGGMAGIFLLTTKEPYDPNAPPLKILLNRKNFGYKIGAGEGEIKDASFVVSGTGPYCLAFKDGSKVVLNTTAKEEKDVCVWSRSTLHEPDKNYKKLFKKGYPLSDFTWEDCPTDLKVDDIDKSNDTNANNTDLKPFATSKVNKGGRAKNNSSVNDGQKEGNSSAAKGPEPDLSSEEREDPVNNDTNATQPVIFAIQMDDCFSLPKFDDTDPVCEFMKPDNLNCEKLGVAMELDPDDSGSTTGKRQTTSSGNGPLTLVGSPVLSWKHDVLTMVATIFSKICIPIRKQSVFQLMNVIGNYIASAHTDDPENAEPNNAYVQKTPMWNIILSSLHRCQHSNRTVPMEWEWTDTISEQTKRRKRQIPQETNVKASVFGGEHVKIPDVLEEEVEETDRSKLIIERSVPRSVPRLGVYRSNYRDDDIGEGDSSHKIIYGNVPRLNRQTPEPGKIPAGLEKLPLPTIQEYWPPESDSPESKATYEKFIFHPDPSKIRIKGHADKQIFYYEDLVEHSMELNRAIDAFWKIVATVVGFCQINEISRDNAVFPLMLYHFEQYFLDLIVEQWKNPSLEVEVEMVAGEFLDEDRSKWLDTCLETAHILGDSVKFRPARPLEIIEGAGASERIKGNSFVELPEQIQGGSTKYFVRKKL